MDVFDLRWLIGPDSGDISWWQMSVRAVLIFIFGLALVRIAGKRVFGKWGAMDIILSIVIGSNLSRALTGTAPLWPTLVATTLLVVLHAALAALAVRVRWLGPLLKGAPERLVKDGEVDERALRRHGVGTHDLQEGLRSAGVGDVDDAR